MGAGLVIGILKALAMGRVLQSQLNVPATNPLVVAGVTLAFAVCGLIATAGTSGRVVGPSVHPEGVTGSGHENPVGTQILHTGGPPASLCRFLTKPRCLSQNLRTESDLVT